MIFVLSVSWYISSSLMLLEDNLGDYWAVAEVQAPFQSRL